MRIKYFRDTDTALLEFSDKQVAETREVSEDVLVDLDEHGNLVSMTVEHASERAMLPDVAVEEIGAQQRHAPEEGSVTAPSEQGPRQASQVMPDVMRGK